MSNPKTIKSTSGDPLAQTINLAERAEDNLQFIRTTMENASVFTGISGTGYVLTGITALLASWLAMTQTDPQYWLVVWMGELALATLVASVFTWIKMRTQGRLWQLSTIRKLLCAFLPAMFAGGVLTLVMAREHLIDLLPGIWLMLYGVAVITAGAWSVRVLPVMGSMFMVLGVLALLIPETADWLMAIGFGGLHIGFGLLIRRHYGG